VKKHFLIILLISFIILSTYSYGIVDIEIYINNDLIDFENRPILIKDNIFIPMDESLSLLGAQYFWNEENQSISIYKDNMFVKLKLYSDIGFRNGKSFDMDISPVRYRSVIYIPLDFIATSYEIDYIYYDDINSLYLQYAKKSNVYKIYSDRFYKSVAIQKYNLHLDIPYYWNVLDIDNNIYGYASDYENVSAKIEIFKDNQGYSLTDYIDILNTETRLLFGKSTIISDFQKEYYTNGFTGMLTTYLYQVDNDYITSAFYVTKADDIFYIIKFNVSNTATDYILNTIDNIVNSFQIESLSIDTQEEYYVEYSSMYNSNMILNKEIFSNMQVRDYLSFSGSIDDTITELLVEVSKNNESLIFKIPVKEGIFSSKIYTPFGLGKHNIKISLNSEESYAYNSLLVNLDVQTNVIMNFSIVNISPDFTRYTIPEENILSNNTNIKSMAQLITYDGLSDYTKSLLLYKYIIDNVTIDNSILDYNTYNVYLTSTGNDLSLANYFVSLLRSIKIPSKVVTGTYEDIPHYWVEIHINNSWIVSDVSWGITGDAFYFNINKQNYYLNFTDIKDYTIPIDDPLVENE